MAVNQENIENKSARPVMNFLAVTSKFLPAVAPAAPKPAPKPTAKPAGPRCRLCGSTEKLIFTRAADMGVLCLEHSERACELITAYHCVNHGGLTPANVEKELRLREEFRTEFKIKENERHRIWAAKLKYELARKLAGVNTAPKRF